MEKDNSKIFFGFVFGLSGVSIFLYQIYYWLRYAEWNSFSLLWPLSFASGGLQDWVYYPYEWVGIHKILDFLPLSIILILISCLFLFYDEY